MQFLNKTPNIDFMGKRKLAYILSAILIVIGVTSLVTRGLNFGLDFTGGTLVEVGYQQAPDLGDIRSRLGDAGYDGAVVSTFGDPSDIMIRLPLLEGETDSDEVASQVIAALQQGEVQQVDLRRREYVSPQVGDELRTDGIMAVLYALVGIFIYVMFRFQWRFSAGAVAALVHDILVTMGVLSLFQVEFDLSVVAALLAVIGYSLNDTIVLFDRIRENFPKLRKALPVDVVNQSVNETLSRTLMTSVTTLIVLIALFFLGGEIIHSFAFTLIIGVIVGTYSSIYVASSALLALGVSKDDLIQVEKEGADHQAMI